MHHHLKVTGMSCGHCVSKIEKTVKGLDPQAEVSADIGKGEVTVSSILETASFTDAIREAGYENEAISA